MTMNDEHGSLLVRRLTHRYGTLPRSGDFPLTTDQLSELHSPKSLKIFNKLFQNDEENLFKFLKTDKIKGIILPDDKSYLKEERYQIYSDNRIPERVGKTFLQLVWEALHDKTMILLTAAAIVSFLLGLYELIYQPPQYDPEGNPIKQVDWIEGIAIMTAVVVVVVVGALNDYQKELQFARLNKKKEDRDIIVIRNGNEILISIHDILVGDVINLQTGDVVPADSILISGTCEADESSMTGESDTIKKVDLTTSLKSYEELKQKDPQNNTLDIGYSTKDGDKVPDCILISGSKLLSGLGKAVVTAVGTNSIYGRTMMSLKVEPDPTPLQERLSQLADSISVYGCVAAMILFLVLFFRFLIYTLLPDGRFHDLDPAQKGSKFMNIFITAVTVIVVAVPEGLPLAVTLALAFATTRMTKDGNLVRNLRACETMGSATAVCSDKTGTLTENIMSIVKGVFGDSYFDDGDFERTSQQTSHEIFNKQGQFCSKELKQVVLSNIILNSTAFENKEYSPEHDSDQNDTANHEELMSSIERGRIEAYIGSKTETALLNMSRKALGVQFGNLQKMRTNTIEYFQIEKIVQVIPFESSRKWAGVVVKLQGSDTYRFFVKGAAEIVSRKCKYKTLSNNKTVEINDNVMTDIKEEINKLAVDALRAISLAHRDFLNCKSWPPKEFKDKTEDDEKTMEASPELLLGKVLEQNNGVDSMTLDGIVGIQDPLRKGVRDSVLQCQRAGVTVRMVTGDNITTARAIARNCNILTPENFAESDRAMEGPQFRKLTKEERIKILPNLRVLARSSPEDKRILVETLKGMGNVVAATGDGTNDAPALKLADVGFSMGISGTEVAREASDIILMTDDFSAIVDAIKWGRCVSISIKKFIQFQLIVNVTAVVLTFVSSVASEDETSVLTAVQLLWVNLIMDTLAALALATDKPDPSIMERKPRGRSTPLITPSTWKMILGQATLQLIITFILHFGGQKIFFPNDETITGFQQQQLNAMTFNTFVWLQFFTLIVSRKLDECDGITNWRERITKVNLDFFQDLFRNYYFLTVMALIGTCQVLIMFYGGAPFSIAPQTPAMWKTAVLCGTLSLPVGLLIRIVPDEVAMKIFPRRLFDKLNYYVSFEFLRHKQGSPSDEESLLPEGEEEAFSSSASAFY
ncbi:similar to Saccharomyces cerevisiae YGL006W PMC1 Vacuolar Ca2+ ATPase involved in depleting cytosol of Ca2+ ions [Maudiozyma saulgeensis]|uniref:Calcium-transporting ATPase n=1 Tax=Maudiozyma saulgeensis TaxID=1789683 RepID=A0A1X7RBD7_9SACH|nr:similar to Saccharomyces cerevisiae YGL006W PMC1 Vacuolar Ca2+ ATPase involved in depleting cytosol of Ca2+ ions [Kazachstania saulgeensis]